MNNNTSPMPNSQGGDAFGGFPNNCELCPASFPSSFGLLIHMGMRHKKTTSTTLKTTRKEKRTAYQLAIIKRFMNPSQFTDFNRNYEEAMKSTPRMDKRAKDIIKYMKANRTMPMIQIAKHFNLSEYNLMKIVASAVTGR